MKGKISIVGSGLIGRSWAMLFAGAGYTVQLYDLNTEQLKAALADIETQLHLLHKEGLLRSKMSPEEQLKLISTTTCLKECLKDAIYVQECVWERLEAKVEIFKELDKVAVAGQILASSTSTIPPSKFTSELIHKDHCIVAHPVNPPFYCPLVELVPNGWTKAEVMATTEALMKEIGQSPVKLKKEIVGFALNRVQYALLAECWRLVQDDVMDVYDIDKIFTEGLGMRYAFLGPLEVTHLNAEGVLEYCQKYNKGYLDVCNTMGPPPSWEGELLEKVREPLETAVPLDQLQKMRQWRDVRLAGLAKLKRSLDAKTD